LIAKLDGPKRIGLIVGRTLEAMRAAAEPGMTTTELDVIAAELLEHEGARSGPA
jgi:methionyl aminopeptidase